MPDSPQAIPIPGGRIAFFIDPDAGDHIRYGLIASKNRYADDVTVYEFPRGAPDSIYVNESIPRDQPNRTLIVEWGKEEKALGQLGITPKTNESPIDALKHAGYILAYQESLHLAAAREGWEEHGFSAIAYPEKLVRIMQLNTLLAFESFYSPNQQYHQYIELVHITDPNGIALKKTMGKQEKKIPERIGASYSEEGTWTTFAEVEAQANQLPLGRTRDYAESVVRNLRDIELAMVGILRTGASIQDGWSSIIPGGQIKTATSIINGPGSIAEIARASKSIRVVILQDFPDTIKHLAKGFRTILIT